MSDIFTLAEKREEQTFSVLEKIYSAARPSAVYSEPLTIGNYTVITASECAAGGGFGSGFGGGSTATPSERAEETSQAQSDTGSGGGSGGGGGSSGRPVAVIVVGPDGVTVKSVVDATKIALAGLTAFGTMIMVLRKIRKASKR